MSWLDFLFAFEGRITRRQYWSGYFLPMALIMLAAIVGTSPTIEGGFVIAATWVVLVVPGFAVGAKRLHDIGLTGWVQAIWLVQPFGSMVLFAMCGFMRGEPGPNKYGPAPLSDTA